eukprot:CAMPEP_0175839134 /NCGR_PEP_ID=MMETSP0107_2-20121207/18639_1 /TAXON_ID=195067 ORGANISM="Goniomonas pacifica, Strain CCMP1869" /NCGR_SAMPLE_ID=MMETSP0107_2 /ASSEMBLY_ACC=CAM_ASM_000203 /LENGTH=42 /DNA_ID= /DNA_START= /DNA_END= /DNA_ORIENTATION=
MKNRESEAEDAGMLSTIAKLQAENDRLRRQVDSMLREGLAPP